MRSVCLLLSTYNGEKFLEEQLTSLVNQTSIVPKILVRDDCSLDGTHEILNKWEHEHLLQWYTGDNLGPAKSFWNLICKAPDSEYYAFSDQDDVWMQDKLSVAVEYLQQYDEPALYCGAYQMTDKDLNPIKTPQITPSTDIYHAIVENAATGCTMVFNKKLLQVIKSYTPDYYFMHDEWIYKVCVAIGGKVIFDPQPYIYYRQHGNNVIGGLGDSWYKRLKFNAIKLLKPSTHHRYKTVKEIVRGFQCVLPDDNKELLEKVLLANKFPYNFFLAFNLNFYRNTTLRQSLKLFFLFIMKKF